MFKALRLTPDLCLTEALLLMRTLVSANSPILTSMQPLIVCDLLQQQEPKCPDALTEPDAAYLLLRYAASFKIVSHTHQ